MRSGTVLAFLLGAIALAAVLLVTRGDQPIAGLEADQFASLVYVGLWGSVLATGLLVAFRGRWGAAAKSAGIWIVAFAALIAAYAFAAEFRDVGQRMLAVLMPGRAVELSTESGQVMVARGSDEYFHIDAEVNGRRIPFLVDTGASVIAIDRDTAEAIGIDPAGLRYTARIRTANGLTLAAPVRLDEVEVGSIVRRNVSAVVTDGEGIGVSLLGMSFLGTLSSFDFRGNRLVLTD